MTKLCRGQSVYTLTYDLLGRTRDVGGDFFTVETNDDGVLTIRREAVYNVDGSRVTLICDRSGLSRYLACVAQ